MEDEAIERKTQDKAKCSNILTIVRPNKRIMSDLLGLATLMWT